MIRRRAYPLVRLRNYLALLKPPRKRSRHKHVIKPHVRIPRRERIPLNLRIERAKTIVIPRVEHQLNRLALQLPTTDPNQRSQPRRHLMNVQSFTRRERVEVANQNVKAVLMSLNPVEER